MSIDLSLDRLRLLVGHLPQYTRPTLHVTGTNGKGSVTSIISSVLLASSLTCGRFNSPHLTSVRDCILINDEPVDPQTYAAARSYVGRSDKEHDTKLSNFELLTLTALYIFEYLKVDIAVVEVGMGGRLDATNIIPDSAILVSGMTAVDLDHQAFLGPTVADIAKEKAGIARAGRPFVLGTQKHSEVEEIVKRSVDAVNGIFVSMIQVKRRVWDTSIDGDLSPPVSLSPLSFIPPPPQPVAISMPCFASDVHALLPLYGDHQLDNLGTAVTIISAALSHQSNMHAKLREHITPATIAAGVKSTRWLGRLSFHICRHVSDNPMIVLADGAHNPASAVTLGAYLTHFFSLIPQLQNSQRPVTITFIIALSRSPPKSPLQTLSPILSSSLLNNKFTIRTRVGIVLFSPPEGMPWVKSVPLAELGDVVKALAPAADLWVAAEESQEQLLDALKWAAEEVNENSLVVVAGSLYLVADFYRYLQETVPVTD